MKSLPVVAVTVLDHGKPFELHAIAPLQPAGCFCKNRVWHWLASPPSGTQPLFFDRALVAKELGSSPRDFVAKCAEDLIVPDKPSSADVGPAPLIQLQSLDGRSRVDVRGWIHLVILVRGSCASGYGQVMSETVNRLTNIVNGFDARIQAAASDSWTNQSPCDQWTARDVVAHVIGSARGMTAGLQGQEPHPLTADDEIVAAWNSTKEGLLSAVAAADLSQNVPGPFGPMPAEQLIGRFMTTDILVHTWDLARAVGGDEQLDADAVAGAYSGLKPMDAMIRGRGVFGDKIETQPGSDLQTEFLQFLGRTV
jgi:uncharacterized protein (TIGR03086 family)